MERLSRSRQKIQERDTAVRRLHSLTLGAAALAVGGAGVIAAFVAAKTHTRASAQRTIAAARPTERSIPAVPAPTATVSSGSAAPQAPQSAPSGSTAAAVAVSGGS